MAVVQPVKKERKNNPMSEPVWNFEQEPSDEPSDETAINLRAYFDLMSDAKLQQYSPTWTDEQTITWDDNFRNDGYLMLLCSERDVDVHEYRRVLETCIAYRRTVRAKMKRGAPEGWPSITPRLFAKDQEALIEFLRRAFSATGECEPDIPCQLRIGDSLVMVSGADVREPTKSFLYIYVEDTDATYARALSAGGESIEEPRDMHYGDRRAMVRDPGGNIWQIATHNEQAFREFMNNR